MIYFTQYVIILKETKIQVLGFNRLLTYNFLNIKLLFPISFFWGGGGRSKNKQSIPNNFTKTFFSKTTILEERKVFKTL